MQVCEHPDDNTGKRDGQDLHQRSRLRSGTELCQEAPSKPHPSGERGISVFTTGNRRWSICAPRFLSLFLRSNRSHKAGSRTAFKVLIDPRQASTPGLPGRGQGLQHSGIWSATAANAGMGAMHLEGSCSGQCRGDHAGRLGEVQAQASAPGSMPDGQHSSANAEEAAATQRERNRSQVASWTQGTVQALGRGRALCRGVG